MPSETVSSRSPAQKPATAPTIEPVSSATTATVTRTMSAEPLPMWSGAKYGELEEDGDEDGAERLEHRDGHGRLGTGPLRSRITTWSMLPRSANGLMRTSLKGSVSLWLTLSTCPTGIQLG